MYKINKDKNIFMRFNCDKKFSILVVTILLQFMFCLSSFAVNDPPITMPLLGSMGKVHVDSSTTVTDLLNYFDKSKIEKTYSIKNIVSVGIEEESSYFIQSDFTASVMLRIYKYDSVNIDQVVDSLDTLLIVDYKKAEGVQHNSLQYYVFENSYRVQVKILSIDKHGVTWDISRVLKIGNEINITRDYFFDCLTANVTGLELVDSLEHFGELEARWNENSSAGISEYDLEWAWVDSAALDSYKTIDDLDQVKIFDNNATRITTEKNSYRIPMLYDGAGLLFIRLRPAQIKENGQRVEGKWTSQTDITPVYFIYGGHESSLNWQASTSFAEEGKRKSVVQYFDGTLRNRQTVTKDNTLGTTLIAESFYDYQGRPVVQVLPAPTLNTILKYTKNFNRAINYDSYPKWVYDKLDTNASVCGNPAEPFDSAYGTAKYYSTQNEDVNNTSTIYNKTNYIPNANGRPFTESRFAPDGRLAFQSGVGQTHEIGSEHETKYLYEGADQKELDALFGTDAGNSSHYFKNWVRDANQQYSISYVDMHGRTIATALAGKVPDSLQALTSFNTKLFTKQLIDSSNYVSGKSIISSKSLVVPTAGSYRFKYELNPDQLKLVNCHSDTICFNCRYNLDIIISSECVKSNGSVSFPFKISENNFSLDTTCHSNGKADVLFSKDTSIVLPEGYYTVTKILTINDSVQNIYRDRFVRTDTCKTFQYFFNKEYALLDSFSVCNQTCEKCIAAIGSSEAEYTQIFKQQSGMTEDAILDSELIAQLKFSYKKSKEKCDLLCYPDSSTGMESINSIRSVMLLDVTPPLGQYAKLEESNKLFNIFSNKGWRDQFKQTEPAYKKPIVDLGDTSYTINYLDELGQVDKSISTSVKPEEFINFPFKTSWAEQLLPHHPEYAKLKASEEKLPPAYHFEQILNKTKKWSEAELKGFIPTSLASVNLLTGLDSFFTGVGSGYKTSMETKMSHYSNLPGFCNFSSYTTKMWQIAIATVMCRNTTDNGACSGNPQKACLDNYQNAIPDTLTACDQDKDMIWTIYKSLYLTERKKFISTYLNSLYSGTKIIDSLRANHYDERFDNFGEIPNNINNSDNGVGTQNFFSAIKSNPVNPTSATAYGKAVQEALYDSICSGYTALWISKLRDCPAIAARWDTISNFSSDTAWVISRLRYICRHAFDSAHYGGAQSIKPGASPIDGFSEFPQVLESFFTTHGISTNELCYQFMITVPSGKYENQPKATNEVLYTKPSSCQCDRLTELKNEYTASSYTGNFSAYLQHTYSTKISQEKLDTLESLCNGSYHCIFLPNPITLPPLMQCDSNRAKTCITCSEFQTIRDSYDSSFHSIAPIINPQTVHQVDINTSFENFANYQTGFTLTWQDYVAFMQTCQSGGYMLESDSTSTSCGRLGNIIYNFRNSLKDSTSYTPEYDSSGCDQRYWKIYTTTADGINYQNPNYNKGIPSPFKMSEWIQDTLPGAHGVLRMPDSDIDRVTDSLTGYSTGYVYVDSLCLNNNMSFETRFRFPIDTAKRAHYILNPNIYGGGHPYPNPAAATNLYGSSCFRFDFDGGKRIGIQPLTLNTWNNFSTNGNINLGFFVQAPGISEINPVSANINSSGTDFIYSGLTNLSDWDTLKMQITNGHLTISVNGNILVNNLATNLNFKKFYKLCMQPFGYDLQVDWVKMYDELGNMRYFEDFDSCINRNKQTLPRYCEDNCQLDFVDYYNMGYRRENINNSSIFLNYPPTPVSFNTIDYQFLNSCQKHALPCSDDDEPRLCGLNEPEFKSAPLPEDTCGKDNADYALTIAEEKWGLYNDSVRNIFDSAYYNKCINAKNLESFTVQYNTSEYHYTLYYYDQAGNLVSTVPPAGVDDKHGETAFLDSVEQARANGLIKVPHHRLVTNYRYNTLNQVVAQKTPDAGVSKFWYDRLGRLVVSQNNQQKNDHNYSYTIYDSLGRITQVGQRPANNCPSNSKDPVALSRWLNGGTDTPDGKKEQITITVYDDPNKALQDDDPDISLTWQRNLRNRVSYTMFVNKETDLGLMAVDDSDINGHQDSISVAYPTSNYAATYYTYDIHGNVDTLLQRHNDSTLRLSGNVFKKIVYNYDLISGKMNKVSYQPGYVDEFYHKYLYDAENRITDVYTSHDNIIWETDARYSYYKHGPLARTIIGQQQVQGIDYAYTLQGWLKGVNGTSAPLTLNPIGQDIGKDGTLSNSTGVINQVARDAYSFNLHYFNADYSAIGGQTPFATASSNALFNGNISAMAVNIPKLGNTMLYRYKYDQLNRLVQLNAFAGFDTANNSWSQAKATNAYGEKISYDANGNILSFIRHGDDKRISMDSMYYSYNPNNNQLTKVDDKAMNASDGDYPKYNDIKSGQTNDNYKYDSIGNLIYDRSEGIDSIKWTVYGKIGKIYKTGNKQIIYGYDASGNRISKTVSTPSVTKNTFYVRDVSGNVMSVYEKPGNVDTLKQTEIDLYGSSRLGIFNINRDVNNLQKSDNSNKISTFTRGEKSYELSNHLGNVLVTVSDRKLLHTLQSGTSNENCQSGSGVDVLNVDRRETYIEKYIASREINFTYHPGDVANRHFESKTPDRFEAYINRSLPNCIPYSDTAKIPEGSYYTADVVTANDYYSFGMIMPGRTYSSGNEYKYGFNGKEKDKYAGKSLQDYGMRIYDGRMGKFLSVDLLTPNYPMLTPYQFASNTPIAAIDLDGLEATFNYASMSAALKEPQVSDVRNETHKNIAAMAKTVSKPVNPETWTDFDIYKDFNKEKLYEVKRNFVADYKAVINKAAAQYDIPPVLLAGVAFNEFGGDPPSIDDAAYAVRIFTGGAPKTSFGDLSMQLQVGMETLGYKKTETLLKGNEVIKSLQDPMQAFFIVAKHLSNLKNVDFKGKTADQLTAEDIKIIGTRYNRGAGLSLASIKKNLSYGQAIVKRMTELKKLITETKPVVIKTP